MNQWEKTINDRNKLIIKLLWGIYFSLIILLYIKSYEGILYPFLGFILCIGLSVLTYSKLNSTFVMYFISTVLFIFFFFLTNHYHNFVTMIFIWSALILSSLYQDYKMIILSSFYSITLIIYTFMFHGIENIARLERVDGVYFVLFAIFITIYIILNTKINKELWIREKKDDEQLKSILDSVNIIAWNFDLKTKEIVFSEGIKKITDYDKQELKENRTLWKEVICEKDREKVIRVIEKISNGETKVVEARIITKNGREKWIQIRAIPNINHNGEVIRINGVIIDITERKCMEEEIRYVAYHDILTKLPNRVQFNKHFSEILSEAKYKNQKMAVLFIDLDKFKTVNDTLGHDMGDVLLKEAANRLKKSLRETDFVCRLGGDEFVILLRDITLNQVKILAQRIVNIFQNPFELNNNKIFVTPSIGISIYPNHGNDIETLIKKADNAMYLAKKNGKNNYQFFSLIKEKI